MNMTLERLKAEEAEAEAMFSNPSTEEAPAPQAEPQFIETTTEPHTQDELEAAEFMEQSITAPEPTEFADPQPVPVEGRPKPKRTDWKKRFTNFKASADTTIYELRSEISSLKSQLSIALDDARLAKAAAHEAGTTKDPFDGVFSEEDEATFGADGLDVVKKATKTAIDKATKPLQDRLDAAEKQRIDSLNREASASAQIQYDKFINGLETLVPNFRTVDTDPGFLKWMKQPDTYSGITRASLFGKAEDARDVARVAEFFVEYSQLTAPIDQMEKHITPVGGGSAPVAPAARPKEKGQIIYQSEIDTFYDDVMRGRYVGRHDEVLNIEAQIDAAMVGGRIKQG